MTLFRTFSVVSLGMTTPPRPISARVSLGAGLKTGPVLTHWFPFFLPGNLPGTPLLTLQVSGLTSSFLDYDPAKGKVSFLFFLTLFLL